MQQRRGLGGHVLVGAASDGQGGVHVHVVTRDVQSEQHLEEDGPLGERQRQKAQQTSGRGTVSDHVQHGAETAHLVVLARHGTVKGVQKTRGGVHETGSDRARRHREEGDHSGDHTGVADLVRNVPEDILGGGDSRTH